MSSSNKRPQRSHQARPGRESRIVIRGVQRERPDLRKLSRAVIAMAQAEAEREAQAQHQQDHSQHHSKESGDEES
jgi:hypothetical protein